MCHVVCSKDDKNKTAVLYLSSTEMDAMKPPLTCAWSHGAMTESHVIWPEIPFQPCEVGQVLVPHPQVVKNPEAEQEAWHTFVFKAHTPSCPSPASHPHCTHCPKCYSWDAGLCLGALGNDWQ